MTPRRGGPLPTGDEKKIQFDPETLIAQEAKLKKIYKPEDDSTFDTSEMDAAETVKKIARTILLKPYTTFDFSVRLDEICKDGEL